MDWFLYHNSLRHERVNENFTIKVIISKKKLTCISLYDKDLWHAKALFNTNYKK